VSEERKAPKLPTREAQARQALVAIALVFFVGVAIGFVLAKTL
jgi:hypothetical protein